MTFETLGTRAVLSFGNPLATPGTWDAPHFEAPQPARFEPISDFAGRGGVQSPLAGMGRIDAYGLDPRYAGPQASLVTVPATLVVGGVPQATGTAVLYVTTGDGFRGPQASVLWFDFGGAAAAPPSPAASLTAPPRDPAPPRGSGLMPSYTSQEIASATASGSSVPRAAASSAIASQTAASQSAGGFQLLPGSASASAADVYRREGAAAMSNSAPSGQSSLGQYDNEGGLIESDTRPQGGSRLVPPSDGRDRLKTDDRLDPDRIEEALDEMLVPDEDLAAEGSDESADNRSADKTMPPLATELPASKFDDGGTIELAAGHAVPHGAAMASSGLATPRQDVEITIDAGVAMFQAFELGSESHGAAVESAPPTAAAPASGNPSASGDGKARALDKHGAPRPTAANLAVGMLAALPFALRKKNRTDEERLRDLRLRR